MQEYKIIKNILLDYMDSDLISYSEEENLFLTPAFIISESDDIWYISFNLTFYNHPSSIFSCTNLVTELMNHQIMLNIDVSYHTIVDKNNTFIGEIWECDIFTLIEEREGNLSYEEALQELKFNLLKEYGEKEFSKDISEEKFNLN